MVQLKQILERCKNSWGYFRHRHGFIFATITPIHLGDVKSFDCLKNKFQSELDRVTIRLNAGNAFPAWRAPWSPRPEEMQSQSQWKKVLEGVLNALESSPCIWDAMSEHYAQYEQKLEEKRLELDETLKATRMH